MPGASLLTLLDDLTTILDDVATLTKVATKKTAGVLGDDLALNAQQVTGVGAERELPVVFAVAKGSARNKLILVPSALLISALLPAAITPLLMVGGGYLCFEGAEKIAHALLPHAPDDAAPKGAATSEADKIRGAIRTDFILSAEIVVIALGAIGDVPLGTRIASLCAIAALMTVGVYALVAAIVKLDDLGLALRARGGRALRAIGAGLLRLAPWLMRGLSIAGTVAMFLVGGGILAHGVPGLEARLDALVKPAGVLASTLRTASIAGLGVGAGLLLLLLVLAAKRLRGSPAR